MQKVTLGSFSSVHIRCWAVVSVSPLLCPSLSLAVSSNSARDKTPTLCALVTTIVLVLLQSQLNGWCVHSSCSHQTTGLCCKGQEARVHRTHGCPPGMGAQGTWVHRGRGCTEDMDTQPGHCSSIFSSPSSLLKQCKPSLEYMLQGQLKHGGSLSYKMDATHFACSHYLGEGCKLEAVSQWGKQRKSWPLSRKQKVDMQCDKSQTDFED